MKQTAPHVNDSRRALLWIALITAFLLLSFIRPLLGGTFAEKASRSESFNASGTIRSLTVKGINGEVEVSAGSSFTATVAVTVRADTRERAEKTLKETKVVFENEGGRLFLATQEPGGRIVLVSGKKKLSTSRSGNEKYRVEAKVAVTLPAGAELDVSTINGTLVTKGLAARQDLQTVNGKIDVAEARRELKLKTVNGAITASCAEVPSDSRIEAETVNGDVVVTLPSGTGFQFSAKTMNGRIESTFPLSPRTNAETSTEVESKNAVREVERAERDRARAERDQTRAERKREAAGGEGDLDEWNAEMSEFSREMEKLGREMGRLGTEISRNVRVRINRSYEAMVGSGGAKVRISTLNGRVTLLAEGTKAADAKDLLSHDRVITVHVPRIKEHRLVVTVPPIPPVGPLPPLPRVPRVPAVPGFAGEKNETRVGDVEGDFTSTSPTGDVVVGRVNGFAKIRTRSGQITLREAVKGANLSASGGDVKVETVGGDLEARTLGGDVTVGSVTGSAKLETMGGDISLRSAGGSVKARTAGGDIQLKKVSGPVEAETLGGTIVCEITGKVASGGVDLSSGGGDVTLILPPGAHADVEVQAKGGDSEIRSDFQELTIARSAGSVRAEGKLGGGGPKIVIQASSGTVTVKKG